MLDFLSDEGFRNARLDGKGGFEIHLRVANYRSLPIDQILDFTVAVDGKDVRKEDITFLLEGHRYKRIGTIKQLMSDKRLGDDLRWS